MWKRVFASVAIMVLGTAGLSSLEAQVTRVSENDQSFMAKAAEGGAAEVELGRLAAARAVNPVVRQFGQRMVVDHGAANAQLEALAATKGIDLPKEPGPQHRVTYDRLAALHGQEFDRAYMLDMVQDHDKDVLEFERASTAIRDPGVKAWVVQTLPTLREHQRMAHQLSAVMAQRAPGPVVGTSPSALPATVLYVPSRTVGRWCAGTWDSGVGTNFGTCSR